MTSHVPQFPRGFLLSIARVAPPATYVPGPLLENFYVHPWTNVDYAGDRGLFVILLGTCVSTSPGDDEQPAERLLSALRLGDPAFLALLDRYAGRHAIVFGTTAHPRIVNDATAMRSIFYGSEGGVVASHALLIEQALGGSPERDELPFRYGFPGNRTPYTRTRLLTANTYYDVATHEVSRFWPASEPPRRSVESAAAEVLERATTALRKIASERPVRMALTAGLDSRTMLAVALHSRIHFETYTYGRASDTEMDRALAADLAEQVGVAHAVVPPVKMTADLRSSLSGSHYANHHQSSVPSLSEFINNPDTAAVTANLLEIGRSFYAAARRSGFQPPVTADAMARLHHRSMGGSGKKEAEAYGQDAYFKNSKSAFQGFIDTCGGPAPDLLDAFDRFYWEHRMSAWHGAAMVERDYYAEAFIPFNARRIFEALLGVPQQERDSSAVFYRLIEMVNPKLLDLPINPKAWPPEDES